MKFYDTYFKNGDVLLGIEIDGKVFNYCIIKHK